MSEFTGRHQGNALVRPYVLAVGHADPGPLPEAAEPHPSTVVLVVDGHTTVDVTRNVGHTGLTGLTVTRGESSTTVALPAPTVAALRLALAEASRPEGGGRR